MLCAIGVQWVQGGVAGCEPYVSVVLFVLLATTHTLIIKHMTYMIMNNRDGPRRVRIVALNGRSTNYHVLKFM